MNKFNYFKVSDLLLDTDIRKSELWVYLTHCRATGSIKGKGNSYAGLNAVVNTFGNTINKKVYDNCIKSLSDKGLIEVIDPKEEKMYTGFYKSDIGVKIVKGKTNIQVPINLLDKKIITNLGVEEIKDIIRLYSLYDPLGSYGGLDYTLINAVNKDTSNGAKYIATFGGGFSRVIYDEKAYKIEKPTNYITSLKLDIKKYIDMKLFKLKPVILEYDIDDEDLTELKGEVFKDLVDFSKNENNFKYMTVLKDNQKAIWVLEPVYPVKNIKYEEYLKYRAIARERAIEIYQKHDRTTRKEIVKEVIYIYNETLIDFINYELIDRKDIEVSKILNLLNELLNNNYTIDSINYLKEEKRLIENEIVKEKQFINSENIRISKEENRRRRHTTTPRLNELKNNNLGLRYKIDYATTTENKLIELIPKWVIDRIYQMI